MKEVQSRRGLWPVELERVRGEILLRFARPRFPLSFPRRINRMASRALSRRKLSGENPLRQRPKQRETISQLTRPRVNRPKTSPTVGLSRGHKFVVEPPVRIPSPPAESPTKPAVLSRSFFANTCLGQRSWGRAVITKQLSWVQTASDRRRFIRLSWKC